MLLLQLLVPNAAGKLEKLDDKQCEILRNAIRLELVTSETINKSTLITKANEVYTDITTNNPSTT